MVKRGGNKKGQLAMETVMIYGIILVVVMVAIGALLYFGVLDVGKYLPDKCDFAPGDFQCNDYQATGSDIQVVVTNMVGKGISIGVAAVTAVTGTPAIAEIKAVTDIVGESSCDLASSDPIIRESDDTAIASGDVLANGEKIRIKFKCNSLSKGDKTDLTFKINYKIVSKEFMRDSIGTVKVKTT